MLHFRFASLRFVFMPYLVGILMLLFAMPVKAQYASYTNCSGYGYTAQSVHGTTPHRSYGESSFYTKTYVWFYPYRWDWELHISKDLYAYYHNKKRLPIYNGNYVPYATDRYDRTYIRSLVKSLRNAAEKAGFNERRTVEYVVAFVQSMNYMKDYESTGKEEYPRYPVETLVDGGGDCEDTSILLAALLYEMGYDVALILLPRHMAVGLAGLDFPGSYYLYCGKKYYYIESTGRREIGSIPKEYQHVSATIFPLGSNNKPEEPRAVMDFNSNYELAYVDSDDEYYYFKVFLYMKNTGTVRADNITGRLYLTGSNGEKYEKRHFHVSYLYAGGKLVKEFIVRVPKHREINLHLRVYGDNIPGMSAQIGRNELLKLVFK